MEFKNKSYNRVCPSGSRLVSGVAPCRRTVALIGQRTRLEFQYTCAVHRRLCNEPQLVVHAGARRRRSRHRRRTRRRGVLVARVGEVVERLGGIFVVLGFTFVVLRQAATRVGRRRGARTIFAACALQEMHRKTGFSTRTSESQFEKPQKIVTLKEKS